MQRNVTTLDALDIAPAGQGHKGPLVFLTMLSAALKGERQVSGHY